MMAKSKSKIPLPRPLSEDRNKLSHRTHHPSDLRRISSDLSKPKNRNNENDENSVHSLDLNSTNLRVRRFTVTIKDSKGAFIKRRQSYKLTYDKDKDGGDEYDIEKHSLSDTSAKGADDTQDVFKDISNNELENDGTKAESPVDVIDAFQAEDHEKREISEPSLKVATSVTVPPFESETSQTNFTDDTSLPIFDDESSESNVALGETYTRDVSAPLQAISPVSGTTIRLLTPQDRNETNILFKNRASRKIAKVRKAEPLVLPQEKNESEIENMTNETEFKIKATPVLKEASSTSIPPTNFKANLFNRIRKISTPRRTPKFSPILNSLTDNKTADNTVLLNKRQNLKSRNLSKETKLTTGVTENTFVKDSSIKRFERINSSESVRSHYDKNLKRGKGEEIPKMTTDNKVQYETVNLEKGVFALKPKRHRRSLETSKSDGRTDKANKELYGKDKRLTAHITNDSGLLTKSAIFSKPVLKQQVKASQRTTQGSVLLKTNNVIESSRNDIFSNQDKRYNLKQAQYINEDLRIVKTKLQDSDFVAQHLDSKLREVIQKKSVLSNLNKFPLPKENVKTQVSQALAASQTIGKSDNKKHQNDTRERYEEIVLKSIKSVPQKENKTVPNHWLNSGHEKNEMKQTVWQVQPKIHRINSDKAKNADRKTGSNSIPQYPKATSNVAEWVLHSARKANRKERPIKTLPGKVLLQNRKKSLNKKLKLVKKQETKRKEIKGTDSKTTEAAEVKENLINAGMYMPIGIKKLKRKPKRLRPRLYTQVGKVKGYESEIPVLYSDDEDGYPEPRPLTDTADRRYPNYRRYEGEHDNVRLNYRDPAHKKIGRWTGALVRFFRNGDVHHKGVPLTVNRNFKNFETLLIHLNDKIPTPTGVHHIFKWPEGTEIKSVTEFRNRCVYVVASTRELKRTVNGMEVNYGESREEFWRNKKPSAGKMRKHEIELYKKPKGHKESPARSSPLVVTIINNVSRDKREKIILNPQTQQDFDEWLRDIANPDLPIKALYSDKPPFAHIKSFSHLFREHQAHSNFLACGDEFMPVEVMKKRQASSSNSSTDSLGDPKSRRKKLQKQQDMGQIYENGRAESPTSTSMSRYDAGPQNDQSRMRLKPRDSRLNIKNPLLENFVEIEVDGALREFYPPSHTDPNDDGAKPKPMLKCEWIYGFRGRDTRHNLMVLPKTKELVYYIASVVVLYDKENDTQRHYTKHNEEITCMTMHPNQNLIATGQMHGKESEHASHIRIWDGVTLSDYSVIGLGVFFGGILSVGFSQDKSGIYMCALDASEKHVLSVWDWQTGRVIARTTTSTDPVHSACFYPDGQNNSILITYGARHIYFWKIFYDVARKREAKILRDRNSGIFEVKKKDEVPDSVNCIAFLGNGDVVTGDTSGNLMIWDRDATDAFTCRHMIQAHPAEVMSVCLMEDGTLLSASQNEIKAWDTNSNFRSVKTRQIPRSAGDIMTLVTHLPGGSDGRLYIGTTYNAILDGSLQNKFKYVVQGHSDGVWCVAPHTFEPTFFSAGFDQVVYKWGLTNHKVIWRTQVEHPCTSIATMEKKKKIDIVAVGTSAGCIYILHAFNGMNITTVQVGREPIGSLAFFPDEVLLAVGSNDGLVSVFQMPDKKTFTKEKTSETGHRSGVAHLDWSKDGRCIQSSSFDNELLFWNRDTMTQVETPATMRNVDWFTITCPLSFNLIGPWSSLERGEVLKVACRSPDRDLCIVGDSKGRLRLFKYPCTKERADYRSARIYSSEVTALAFSADNCGVLTCGGNNAALVQWELIEE